MTPEEWFCEWSACLSLFKDMNTKVYQLCQLSGIDADHLLRTGMAISIDPQTTGLVGADVAALDECQLIVKKLELAIERKRAAGEEEVGKQRVGVNREPPKVVVDGLPFVPTDLQTAILQALDGVAMKKDKLASEVCAGDGRRLYKSGGIKELRDAGRVHHKNGVGYYRPDKPPKCP